MFDCIISMQRIHQQQATDIFQKMTTRIQIQSGKSRGGDVEEVRGCNVLTLSVKALYKKKNIQVLVGNQEQSCKSVCLRQYELQ